MKVFLSTCLAIATAFLSGCNTSNASLKYAFADGIPTPTVAPVLIDDPEPEYPKPLNSLDPWLEGKAEVIFVVETDGSVVDAAGTAPDPRLRDAAVEAVKNWKFEPAIREGRPARCVMSVTINFRKDNHPQGVPSGHIPRQVVRH